MFTPMAQRQSIGTSVPSATIEALRKLYGQFPIGLDLRDAVAFRAMAAASPENEAWSNLVEVLEKYDHIQLDIEC
jgi:hypothetical protein